MTDDVAPYVSAVSVMLAAFGFFYNALRARIDAGLEVGSPAANEAQVKRQRKLVGSAKSVVSLLIVVSVLIWLVFLPAAVEEVNAAFDTGFDLSEYSALDTAFFLLSSSWLLIALLLYTQRRGLTDKERELSAAK